VESNWPFSDVWRDSRENDRPGMVYPDISPPRGFFGGRRAATQVVACIRPENTNVDRSFFISKFDVSYAVAKNDLSRII